jgi:hypothetical protein
MLDNLPPIPSYLSLATGRSNLKFQKCGASKPGDETQTEPGAAAHTSNPS